jgi:amidohydrolase
MVFDRYINLVSIDQNEFQDLLRTIRQHLHSYPELSFQEYNTSNYIISWLEKWKIPYQRLGETGVVVDIQGEKGEGINLGIRGDIDALPITEDTGLFYASKNKGIMHGCGHDGHTAILLGTVYMLQGLKQHLTGSIRCIFQPGEEADGAAKKMIDQGVLKDPKIDRMIALHLWPHLPFGSIGVKYGCITASCDDFTIDIQGKGGHCARPHQGTDAIAISAQIIQAFQYMVSKSNNPVEPLVIHIGKFNGGMATNAIADHVRMEGTARTITQESRIATKKRIVEIVKGMAEQYGAKASISFIEGHPPVINNEHLVQSLEMCGKELFGSEHVFHIKEPSMGADDFGYFSELVPSLYFRLGIQKETEPVYDLHHPKFQFDDKVLEKGVSIFTSIALTWLIKEEN